MENDLKFQIAYLKALQIGQTRTAKAIDDEYKAYLQVLASQKEEQENEINDQNEMEKVLLASNNILSQIKNFNTIDDYISMLKS